MWGESKASRKEANFALNVLRMREFTYSTSIFGPKKKVLRVESLILQAFVLCASKVG